MSVFWDVSVVVAGAVMSELVISDAENLAAFVDGVKIGAGLPDVEGPVEVFVVEHEHADDGRDCACVQFVTDHAPYWSSGVAVV